MIPVQMKPEPLDFNDKVRKKGKIFLQKISHPKTKDWEDKEYWREAIPDLCVAYDSVCAYCAQWISTGTGTPTVDHFISKTKTPSLAYEWSNFRLVCLKLNSRKGVADIIDPFTVQEGFFNLDLRTFMILPNPDLSEEEKVKIRFTIDQLQLNKDESFVEARRSWYEIYIEGHCTFSLLQRLAPFIAQEIKRQNYNLS
jgi:hypothetical protein